MTDKLLDGDWHLSDGITNIAVDGKYTTAALKSKANFPSELRYLHKKDGTTVLQGAHYWSEGWENGFDWEDIPTVEEGND